jgi:hypothetical protein
MTLYEGTLDVFPDRYSSRPRTLSILSTCRQIRYEALPIFYSRNTFDFTDVNSDISQFVKIVSPACLKVIRSIRIDHYGLKLLVSALKKGVPYPPVLAMLPSLSEVVVNSSSLSNKLLVAAIPTIRRSTCKTDTIVGFEAVARWQWR